MAISDLSDTELRTLKLLANGVTNAGIAEQEFITERTVEKRLSHILHEITGLTAQQAKENRVHRRVVAAVEYQVWASRYPALVPSGTHST